MFFGRLRIRVLLSLLVLPLAAQDSPDARGMNHFYNLEYDQALVEFESAEQQNPQAIGPHNHIAQTLLYREMYRNGALETELVSGNNPFLRRPKMNPSPVIEKRFGDEIQKALDLANARLSGNPNDTRALYGRGAAYGLRANYEFLVRKAWRDSLRDATSARKDHNRVTELEPSNYDARFIQGLHDYVVGSLPWHWRMLGFLIGFHGDKDRGIHTVEEVARKGNNNKVDAEMLLCALYRREEKPRQALPLLEDLSRRFPRNNLLLFEEAQMYSSLGNKDKAIGAIDRIAAMKQSGLPGFADVPWEKIYFQLGNIEFWYNDLDRAIENLRKVISSQNEVDLNTGVLAWMRLGQIYDMKNRRAEALDAYKHAIAFAPEADAAKESRGYMSSPYRREKQS
ncbi:MAG TPA: tetratricopeptide repeat protein [Bryobacteraceae bacterium]|nr:tetratricopeptide repeat protein [Bryobacteraceae bacterium]